MFNKMFLTMGLLIPALLSLLALQGSGSAKPDKQAQGLVTSVVATAGNQVQGSTHLIWGTLGQTQPIGRATSPNFRLEAGFWPTVLGRTVTPVEDLPPLVNDMDQNFPNPFNPSTTIGFSVGQASPVSIAVYNVKGELIRTLLKDNLAEGRYTAIWNGKNDDGMSVASGVYFCRLEIGDFKAVKKMLLLQ